MPEDELTSCLTELVVVFKGHTIHMNITAWYPTAQNMLLSAGCDNVVLVWNTGDWIACALTSSITSARIIMAISDAQFAKTRAYTSLSGGRARRGS